MIITSAAVVRQTIAKFEVVGHKYADLSDHDYGVALLNECKFGNMVLDKIIEKKESQKVKNEQALAEIRILEESKKQNFASIKVSYVGT